MDLRCHRSTIWITRRKIATKDVELDTMIELTTFASAYMYLKIFKCQYEHRKVCLCLLFFEDRKTHEIWAKSIVASVSIFYVSMPYCFSILCTTMLYNHDLPKIVEHRIRIVIITLFKKPIVNIIIIKNQESTILEKYLMNQLPRNLTTT